MEQRNQPSVLLGVPGNFLPPISSSKGPKMVKNSLVLYVKFTENCICAIFLGGRSLTFIRFSKASRSKNSEDVLYIQMNIKVYSNSKQNCLPARLIQSVMGKCKLKPQDIPFHTHVTGNSEVCQCQGLEQQELSLAARRVQPLRKTKT